MAPSDRAARSEGVVWGCSPRIRSGKYYRADNAERFRQIYEEIDKLEKTEATINKYTEFKELFPWLVAGGLLLLLIELVLGQTIFRRLP